MPAFEITTPEGRTFQVTAPEGATKEEVLSYVQSQAGAPKSRNSLLDTLAAIDKRAPAAEPQSGTNYILQQANKGLAAGLGMPVDAATNLLNLGIAGYGVAKHELTGSNDLPAPITSPVGGSGTFERLMQVDSNAQPSGPVNRVVGRVARDLAAASVPIAGIAGRPAAFMPRTASTPALLQAQTQSPIPALAAGTGLSLASSLGGEAGRLVAPEPYKDVADLSGQLVGGIALPSMLLSRLQAVKALKDAANPENTNRMASGYVENKIQADVRNFPGAKERLQEAIALQDEIPGFQPRVGQASGVPSLIDMERRVATSGPEQFNKRAIQDQANREAIQAQAEKDLPLLAGKNDVADRLRAVQDERTALADNLPEVAAEDTGQTLRAVRGNLKARYDKVASEKFAAPVEEATRLGVKIDPRDILAKSAEISSNPILEFDRTNAPAILGKIADLGIPVKGELVADAAGRPSREDVIKPITFDQLKGMREAVNQDIAREAGSANPNARQRLRALVEMRGTIDEAAQQAPESVRKLYNDAVGWYRDEYAPKFLRGVNLKQTLKDVTGEQRIADEKLAGQYFKKMAPTPMTRFVDLYGDSPLAMKAMENHVLDTYRREVVKDGVIDPKKHDVFLRNYGPALKQIPDIQKGLDSIGNASRLLSDRETQLADTQSLLSKAQLDRLKLDGGTANDGIDPAKVDAFLKRNGTALRDSLAQVYGQKVADEHMQNLQKIARAAEIAERGRLGPNAFPEQSTNPMDLRSGFGFTSRTVFNMLRAVTTGRTSSEDMAFTLGMQSATHRINKALIAAEERAITDPQTARLVAQSVNQPITSEAGQLTLRKILEKGGLYVANTATGAKNYERMTRYRAAPFAIDATQQGRKQEQR